jgi:hypothetical protein
MNKPEQRRLWALELKRTGWSVRNIAKMLRYCYLLDIKDQTYFGWY